MGFGVGVSPPVEEGETYDVTIEDIGKEGDGVAKIENFVVFVPETDVGDEVEVKINKVLRTLAFGEVVGEASESSETSDDDEDEDSEEIIEEIDEEIEEIEEEEDLEEIETIELE